MSMPNEPEPVILQNDGSNFLSWSIYVFNAFRAASPLIEYIVDASISIPIVDWSNYKKMSEEEKICVQLNSHAINILLSTLSAEVLEEAIYDEDTPSESAHHIWTKLCGLYGKAKCDDAHELNMSMVTSCSQEASINLQSIEPEHVKQVEDDLLPGCSYRTCPVSPVLVRQQGSKFVPTTMTTLDGGQVMNHVPDCKIIITCVSWPRTTRRRPSRKMKSQARRCHMMMIKVRVK